jgi:hypothetical protein
MPKKDKLVTRSQQRDRIRDELFAEFLKERGRKKKVTF